MSVLGLNSKDRKSIRDKANISNPKVNRGCATLTANRTSADCVQISLGPSIPYIPLGVYHTEGFNAMFPPKMWYKMSEIYIRFKSSDYDDNSTIRRLIYLIFYYKYMLYWLLINGVDAAASHLLKTQLALALFPFSRGATRAIEGFVTHICVNRKTRTVFHNPYMQH